MQGQAVVSEYREFPPPAPLASHLLCLWTQSVAGSGSPYAHRVLPDGCVDIVFINDEPPVVVGPYTECFIARLPPGAAVVGARFHPGRAVGLLGHPASDFLNQSVPLEAVWSDAACSEFARVSGEGAVCGRLRALAGALGSRMSRAVRLDPAVNAAIDWLAAHPQGRVEQLSRWTGISSRQLQRRFSAAVGYGPKTFQEVLRFQGLLSLAAQPGGQFGLAHLSVDAGYADQAHMTREVHRFSDTRPTDLLGSAECTLRMSGFFQAEPDVQRK
jgi:AraC-like DNA-binding protein